MKKWLAVVSLVLGAVSSSRAQQSGGEDAARRAAPPQTTGAAAPVPALSYEWHDDYHLQLSMGYSYVHFRSSAFSAHMSGLNTQVVYRTNDWFAVEGTATVAFDSTIYGQPFDKVKYVSYGGGGRIIWQQGRWVPWVHALAGGIHMQPQTALGGRGAFAYAVGGGADWRWKRRVSLRLQGDWVRSMLYGQTQNNIQVITGLVLHF